MKIMKYSMEPALFKEPLEEFLQVFGDLDFLGSSNNLTKSGQTLMERNLNPRVFMCQYAREPREMIKGGIPRCNLFHYSLTNGGFGFTFNQADFWSLYSSTWYTKEFAKIYWPKGFKNFNSHGHFAEKKGWRYSKDNIFYPIQSGQKNGLTVCNSSLKHIEFFYIIPTSLYCMHILDIFTRTQKL